MANFYGTARSNYVKLKPTTIPTLEEMFDITSVTRSDGLTAILSEDVGGTPSFYVEEEGDEQLLKDLGIVNDSIEDLNILDVIHLCLEPDPDNVFVWMEVGAEKARYLVGNAIAIDHTGQVLKQVDLNQIYEPNWTRAEY